MKEESGNSLTLSCVPYKVYDIKVQAMTNELEGELAQFDEVLTNETSKLITLIQF